MTAIPSKNTFSQRFISSRQLLPGEWANAITDLLSSAAALTASTTQTQAGALAGAQIKTALAVVTTGNANDVVALPKGYVGLEVTIANISANTLGVFPYTGDIIFPSAANAKLDQTASKNAIYKCMKQTAAGVATWYKVEGT